MSDNFFEIIESENNCSPKKNNEHRAPLWVTDLFERSFISIDTDSISNLIEDRKNEEIFARILSSGRIRFTSSLFNVCNDFLTNHVVPSFDGKTKMFCFKFIKKKEFGSLVLSFSKNRDSFISMKRVFLALGIRINTKKSYRVFIDQQNKMFCFRM